VGRLPVIATAHDLGRPGTGAHPAAEPKNAIIKQYRILRLEKVRLKFTDDASRDRGARLKRGTARVGCARSRKK